MERINSSLKDMFKTVLTQQAGANKQLAPRAPRHHEPLVVIHGNGNVIAPGGTVHLVMQEPNEQRTIF